MADKRPAEGITPHKIDRFGELQRRREEFAPVEAEYKQLKAEIEAAYDAQPAAQAFEAHGALYTVQIGPKARERQIINMGRIFSYLRKDRFLDLCSFPMKALDAHVPVDMHKMIVRENLAGNRKVHAVAKSQPTAAKAA